MLAYPNISPVIWQYGPIAVRWYGFMYLLAFLSALVLGRYRLRKKQLLSPLLFDNLLIYALFGVILGGRFGYIFFYNLSYYLRHPLDIFAIWNGGLSFHGGLLGVMLALYVFSKKENKNYFDILDFVAPLVPPGLFFGRIGNFINAELWGRVTTAPVGMLFPNAGSLPRHPSQLYEAFGEGIFLFCLLWSFSTKQRPRKAVCGLFALGYGVARFVAEFFREPDPQLGYLLGGYFTMGMLLSIPLVCIGCIFLMQAYQLFLWKQR